jgi:hypothetical protein
MIRASRRRRARLAFTAAALLAFVACDHGKMDVPEAGPGDVQQPASSGEGGSSASGAVPSAGGGAGAAPFAGGAGAGSQGRMGAAPFAGGSAGAGPGGGAGAGPGGGAGAAQAGGGEVSGTITVAPELASKIPSGGTIFVYARMAGVDKGPPLAVARLTADRFPLEFRLGPENVMMQGMPFQGTVSLSARFDSDGNAMSRGPGDIAGSLPEPVEVGTKDLKLELNQPL